MATELNTFVLLQVLSDLQDTGGGAILDDTRVPLTLRESMIDGDDYGKANKVYGPIRRTLAGGAAEELDLAGGSLKDRKGNALTFTKVRLLLVINVKSKDTVGATFEIGGSIGTAGENFLLFKAENDVYELGPGAIFFIYEPSAAGLPVTAGTGDLLRIANVSSPSISMSYDILIIGS